ncbi:threonine--tRNA ligase [Candidatus Microgenomates bacterium]|nr:threonine--tRNA ligase [Candidatus Microgenomates bacterium]
MVKTLKDHREIGRELDLFSTHDVAPGAIFWHPKGWIIYRTLLSFIQEKTEREGYQEISTPVMVKSALFKQSGHWEHFGEHNMFNLTIDNESWSLKPMNCPESTLVYSSRTRSYQDLPLKLSEYGILHRRELSGVLGGLFRVQQFSIDDAHLFVRPDQIQAEIHTLLELVTEFYRSLEFIPHFYLATKPDKAMGDQKLWEEAERDLEIALKRAKVKYDIKPKDGAFYGPKIDIHIRDSQDRDWQLATIQLDFQIPERMKLAYVDRDGSKKRPVMIHRAIFGSFERFIGILIEHYQGAFPLWLSPIQVVVIPVTDRNIEYSQRVVEKLQQEHIRTELDDRAETMQARIRDAELQKVPYILVVGDEEEKGGTVAIRTRGGKEIRELEISELVKNMKAAIEKRTSRLV